MGKTIFVPLTDDFLYDHPERVLGPVVPFTQQGRSTAVEPVVFSLATTDLDATANLQTKGASPAIDLKVDTAFG